jgi:hypothetical protein
MPAGDRTGPWGMGPMTGRGAGYCAGYGAPGYASWLPGRVFGLGWGGGGRGAWGRGRGWRHWYYATGLPRWARAGHAPFWGVPPAAPYGPGASPPTREEELTVLRDQAEWLHGQMEAIARRIAELEKEE